MTLPIPGRSLLAALVPSSETELAALLAEIPCLQCGTFGGDWERDPPQALGGLVYSAFFQVCPCGFEGKLFVLLNLLQGEMSAEKCKDYMISLEQTQLLPDFRRHEGLLFLQLAVFRNQFERALAIATELAESFPEDPMNWYNLAWIYSRLGYLPNALLAYGQTLALDPQCREARDNIDALLLALGLEVEDPELEAKLRHPLAASAQLTTLEEKQGHFGLIQLREDENSRFIWIGERIQGGARLSPSAADYLRERQLEASPELEQQPGPLPAFPFQIAWLFPALHQSDGKGLMLGLGTGMGAVFLLAEFPRLRLEVVEQDGEMLEMARKYFPLLAHFEQEGRLRLHQSEAAAYLRRAESCDFVLVDLFEDQISFPKTLLTQEFFTDLARISPLLAFNQIGREDSPWLLEIRRRCQAAGRPMRAITGTIPPGTWTQKDQNWLLLSQLPDLTGLEAHLQHSLLDGRTSTVRQRQELLRWSKSWTGLEEL